MILYTYNDGSQQWLTDAEYQQAQREERLQEIEALKAELASTDYKAIKFAEGWLTAEEYAPIKAQRQELRNRINELEGEGDGEE